MANETICVGESFSKSTDRPIGRTERYGWGGFGIFGVGEALTRCLPIEAKERPGQAPMWYLEVLRLVGSQSEAVSDVTVTDGVQTARVISFFEVSGEKIRPEPYEPPATRAHLVERMQ